MIQFKRVLVPVDFSDFSDRALQYGREMCRKFGAELHLLHVLEVQVTPQFTMGLAVPQRNEESADAAREKLQRLSGEAEDDQIGPVICETAHGRPADKIVQYANDHGIDVIAIGTHGRTGLSHVLVGSVAENVVRHAACPVLIVRQP